MMYGAILVAVSVLVLSDISPSRAVEKRSRMTGTITAVDTSHQTVVVEVPHGRDMLTVGGPLSAEAQLKKRGKSVQLTAFLVGEKVTVTWRSTGEGPVIERLETR
jgi:hypothetical protein